MSQATFVIVSLVVFSMNSLRADVLSTAEFLEVGDFRIMHAPGQAESAELVGAELLALQADFHIWLEGFDLAMETPNEPLLVLLVSAPEFEVLRQQFGLPIETRGFYRRQENMAVFVPPSGRLTTTEQRVIRHECTHLLQFNCGLFDRSAQDLPLWLVEGMAVRMEIAGEGLCADRIRVNEFLRRYPQPRNLPSVRKLVRTNNGWQHARDQAVAGALVRWLERNAPSVIGRAISLMQQGNWQGDWLDVFSARDVRLTDHFKQKLHTTIEGCGQ